MIFLATLFDDGQYKLTINYKSKEQITKKGNIILLALKTENNLELKRWNACLKINAALGVDFDLVFARAYKFIHILTMKEKKYAKKDKNRSRN